MTKIATRKKRDNNSEVYKYTMGGSRGGGGGGGCVCLCVCGGGGAGGPDPPVNSQKCRVSLQY